MAYFKKVLGWKDFRRTCPYCNGYVPHYIRICPHCHKLVKNFQGGIIIHKEELRRRELHLKKIRERYKQNIQKGIG